MDRTRMPMVVTDARQPDHPIVLANQAFLELSGYAAEEILGRNCRFLQGPETSSAAIAELGMAVSEARDVSVEILNYRKDGTTFWNQLNVSPVRAENGDLLYFFASQIDVTQLRHVQSLEASERRLLMEVDHRARNVLALVSGIVRLTRNDDPDLYAASVQRRVQALARAHSLLADRRWQHVPLADLIRQEANPLGARRVALGGPDLMVAPSAVQPLALVIHELAINAATHGALSRDTGALNVGWVSAPASGDVELRWEEAGGPAPPEVRHEGFGTKIVAGMVERQLRGRIRHDWRPDGVVVTIDLPRAVAA